jgi:hypothetical protein
VLRSWSGRHHEVQTTDGEVLLETAFEDRHGGHTSTAHGDIWELVGGSVCVDGEEMCASRVDPAENEVSTDLSLVPNP